MAAQRASDEVIDRSKIENRAPSVAALFVDRVAHSPNREAFRYVDAQNPTTWTSVTWSEAGDRVRNLAAGLIVLGVQAEQRVALASATRYEWVLADLAVMCAGAATTTVYPTTTAGDVAYIVANSGSRVVFAEDDAQLAKLRENRGDLSDVEKVVLIDGSPGDGDDWVITFQQLHDLGEELLAETPDAVHDRIEAIGPDDLATLIYTSGTTGRPKGVRLSHSAWTYEAAAIDATGILDADDLQYLWLPLSHVFGKVLLTLPLQIGFATAVDGRVDKIVENLAVVKPTFMGAAPRIFEKAYARILSTVREEGGPKEKIFDWAIGVGLRVSKAKQAGKGPSLLDSVQHAVADRLVYSTIRERFGGRLKFFISGSAALNRDVAQWFDAVGIVVLEGYGLSETSAASFVNRPSAYQFGSVGWPIPGTESRIAERRRDPHQGSRCHERVPRERRRHRRSTHRRRLVPHRRHRRDRRQGLPADHRPQEGHVQDVQRQIRRTVRAGRHVQGHLPLRRRDHRRRRRQVLLRRPDLPRRRIHRRLGEDNTTWAANRSPRSRTRRRPATSSAATSRNSTPD